MNKKFLKSIVLSLMISSGIGAFAQTDSIPIPNQETVILAEDPIDEGEIVIPPLFEYVVAPDDLPDLQSRTDYIMENFWNPLDVKNLKVVDQNALNHAFMVYVEAMSYASEDKVTKSVDDLIKRIKNNPGLSFQFVKAAENMFYGPRAEYQGDNIYMKFLANLVDNKKIDTSKKKRYIEQYELLKRTAVGAQLPQFHVLSLSGTPATLNTSKDFTLVGFIPTDCEDCRYTNLKLDISGVVNDMIADNKLDVVMVILESGPSAIEVKESDFPAKWQVISSPDAERILDIRFAPSFYIIDKNKIIKAKNLPVDNAVIALDLLNTSN